MLTQGPQFEKSALASVFVDAATVKAPLAPPASRQASALWLAAVAVTKTPEFWRLCTAVVSAVEGSRETDKFATAGLRWCAVTQSTTAMTSDFTATPTGIPAWSVVHSA